MAGFTELLRPTSWRHDSQGHSLSYSCPVSPPTTTTARAWLGPISQMGLQRPALCLALLRAMPRLLLLPPAGLNWELEITQTEFYSQGPHRTHVLPFVGIASVLGVENKCRFPPASHLGSTPCRWFRSRPEERGPLSLVLAVPPATVHLTVRSSLSPPVCRVTGSSEVRNLSWVLKRRQPSWEERGPLMASADVQTKGPPAHLQITPDPAPPTGPARESRPWGGH